MNKKVEKIIISLLGWRFFHNAWWDLSEEEQNELKKELERIINEKI